MGQPPLDPWEGNGATSPPRKYFQTQEGQGGDWE